MIFEIVDIKKIIEKIEIKMEYLISQINNENLVSNTNKNKKEVDNSR